MAPLGEIVPGGNRTPTFRRAESQGFRARGPGGSESLQRLRPSLFRVEGPSVMWSTGPRCVGQCPVFGVAGLFLFHLLYQRVSLVSVGIRSPPLTSFRTTYQPRSPRNGWSRMVVWGTILPLVCEVEMDTTYSGSAVWRAANAPRGRVEQRRNRRRTDRRTSGRQLTRNLLKSNVNERGKNR